MDNEYWHRRWAEGRIGWHRPEPDPLLVRHWPDLAVATNAKVFVPLCGKSLDMAWLAATGHRVLGVDLSAAACEAFFAEHGSTPTSRPDGRFHRYRAGPIDLCAGDVFDLPPSELADCTACHDRAALIALPPESRRRYATEVLGRLPADCRMLLITLEYPSDERQGPPHSVDEAEVHRLFEPTWRVSLQARLDTLDEEPKFREEGLSRLHTTVYRLRKLR